MVFIVFFLIFLTFLGYIFPKSKIIFGIELILNFLIIGGYNGTGDIDNYMYRYNNKIITEGFIEKLYDLVAILFKNAGVSFEMFHFCLSVISLSIIALVLYKLSNKPALAMALFSGYSTFEYALQIKAMCAASIIIYALYYYYKKIYLQKNTMKEKIIYIVLILIATGFHFMSPVFYIFLFMDSVNIKKIKRYIIPITICVAVFSQYVVNELSKYIFNLTSYVDMHRSTIATISFCIWQIISLIIVKKIMISDFNKENKCEEKIKFDTFVYKGSWSLLLIMPFYSITFVVNRILKIWSAFFYVQASNITVKKGVLSLNLLFMIIYSIGSFILFYFILTNTSGKNYNVILDIMQNNVFWGGV